MPSMTLVLLLFSPSAPSNERVVLAQRYSAYIFLTHAATAAANSAVEERREERRGRGTLTLSSVFPSSKPPFLSLWPLIPSTQALPLTFLQPHQPRTSNQQSTTNVQQRPSALGPFPSPFPLLTTPSTLCYVHEWDRRKKCLVSRVYVFLADGQDCLHECQIH